MSRDVFLIYNFGDPMPIIAEAEHIDGKIRLDEDGYAEVYYPLRFVSMPDQTTPGKAEIGYQALNIIVHFDKLRVHPFCYSAPIKHKHMLQGYYESKERVRTAMAGLIHPGPSIVQP